MWIAVVIVAAAVLLVLAFLLPRLSRGPERGGKRLLGIPKIGTRKLPGRIGHYASKPFSQSQRVLGKSGRAGRKGRGKSPM
ncbi:hypothetical protein EKD16_15045 [Streptomonospora litoralis]|uniref:Uncharacterized protein n=2 Tax=Streptomonospora litoralis TaxID=2498135 RepID=A0A4P6Q7H8_9ACTN|nr:hypothetical protein EKD16_15045 [Streptomonospora litoralis]